MLSAQIGQIKDFGKNSKESLLDIIATATASQAAEKMSSHQVGCLAVVDSGGKFIGIISERDMLSKVLAKSLSPEKVLIQDIMTSSVISCDAQTPVVEVEKIMSEHRIRHLPVLKDNIPIGMVSTRDLIEYRLASNKAMQIAAEQLAMLPAGLKSLDFKDVISLAINEVPKIFGAERAVLCFKTPDDGQPLIFRNSCGISQEQLIKRIENSSSDINKISLDKSCDLCDPKENNQQQYVIYLRINDQSKENPQQQIIPGFLCMCCSKNSAGSFDESQKYKATLLQQILNANLTNATLYLNYQNARQDSETDPLTGVGTRRVLEKVLKAECARSARYNRIFSLAIVDLDKFKQINDTAGHAVGDKALKQLAKLLQKNARDTDIIITRFGGDEFVLVMPETPLKGAKVFLERTRRQMRSLSIPPIEQITISCGVTEWNSIPQDTPESIMARADEALYQAKKAGRNRVVAQGPVEINC